MSARVEPGLNELVTLAPGFAETWTNTRAVAGLQSVPTIRPEPERLLRGRVITSDGLAAAGVRVQATMETEGGGSPPTTTGTDGRFVLRGLADGAVRVFASTAKQGVQGMMVAVAGAQEVELRLDPPAGELFLRTELPGVREGPAFEAWYIPDFDGTVYGGYSADRNYLGATHELGGQLRFLCPDGGFAWATAAGFVSALTALPESDGEGATLTLELEPARPVTGLVVDAATGHPVAGAEVALWLEHPRQFVPQGSCWAAPDGRFEVRLPPPGSLRAHVRAPAYFEAEQLIGDAERTGGLIRLNPAGTLVIEFDEEVRKRRPPPYGVFLWGGGDRPAWHSIRAGAICVAGPLMPGTYSVRLNAELGVQDVVATVEAGRVTTVRVGAE